MQQKIIAYMKQNRMIDRGDRVIAGCSGGADSVCLLLVLHACEKELGFTLSAVHVEHGIRGEESVDDARFVQELCARLGVPLAVCPVDVPTYAKAHGTGLEEAARVLRYEAFVRQAELAAGTRQPDRGAVRIALAHHMEDNAETILFQLARGSGLSGLCGILPVRQEGDISYIRPLLCVTRAEIEQYLVSQGQGWCTDRTNADETYSRNRIRKSVLPQLVSVNAQAVQHMNRSACILSESYDFIRTYTGARYAELVTEEQGQLCICAAALRREHPAVQKELLRMLLFAAAGHRRDIAAVHVEELLALTELQSGRSISLPYGVCAFMEYDTLHLCRDADARGGELPAVLETAVTPDILRTIAEEGTRDGKAAWRGAPGTTGWHTLWRDAKGGCIRARAWRTDAPLEEITKKSYTKQFDYDKIKCGFVVRTRRKGDYIVLDAAGHRKKLSDYMVDQKLPARLRGSIPLLAQGSEVLWLAGGRIGATCRVTKDTTRILEIEYNGGLADGLHKAT